MIRDDSHIQLQLVPSMAHRFLPSARCFHSPSPAFDSSLARSTQLLVYGLQLAMCSWHPFTKPSTGRILVPAPNLAAYKSKHFLRSALPALRAPRPVHCAGLHIQFSMALAVICCNGSCSPCSCSSRVCSALYNSQGPNDDNVEAATNSLLPPLSLSVTIWEFIGHGSVTGQT